MDDKDIKIQLTCKTVNRVEVLLDGDIYITLKKPLSKCYISCVIDQTGYAWRPLYSDTLVGHYMRMVMVDGVFLPDIPVFTQRLLRI